MGLGLALGVRLGLGLGLGLARLRVLHQRQLRLLLRLRRGDELVQLEARGLHLARQLQRLCLHLRCGGGIGLSLRASLPRARSVDCLLSTPSAPVIYPLSACDPRRLDGPAGAEPVWPSSARRSSSISERAWRPREQVSRCEAAQSRESRARLELVSSSSRDRLEIVSSSSRARLELVSRSSRDRLEIVSRRTARRALGLLLSQHPGRHSGSSGRALGP